MEFIRPKKSTIGFDVAPLIDIIFLLLIFFMLSSSFLQPVLRLKLPKAVSEDQSIPESIAVSVDQGGNIFVNALPVTMESLPGHLDSLLAERREIPSVHLRGDENMPYGKFVRIIDLLRQAGIHQINIVHLNE